MTITSPLPTSPYGPAWNGGFVIPSRTENIAAGTTEAHVGQVIPGGLGGVDPSGLPCVRFHRLERSIGNTGALVAEAPTLPAALDLLARTANLFQERQGAWPGGCLQLGPPTSQHAGGIATFTARLYLNLRDLHTVLAAGGLICDLPCLPGMVAMFEGLRRSVWLAAQQQQHQQQQGGQTQARAQSAPSKKNKQRKDKTHATESVPAPLTQQ